MRYPVNFIGITQKFTSSHRGIDLGWNSSNGGQNQPVYACADGKVIYNQKQTNGGNVLHIKHSNGLVSEYAHLQDKSIKVKLNDNVKLGQHIANMGNTGTSSGNHLHFGLFKGTVDYSNGKKNAVNPIDYLEVYPGQTQSSKTKANYKLKIYTEPSKSFLPSRGYFKQGDKSENVGKIASFMYKTFPSYTPKSALGNLYGPNLIKAIKEFQKRTGLVQDGCTGPLTLSKLKSYGFKY